MPTEGEDIFIRMRPEYSCTSTYGLLCYSLVLFCMSTGYTAQIKVARTPLDKISS